MFASLSIFLHSSHVKLALKISASTSMCSNAGFMLAFCPRRLFNIIIFCRKAQLFSARRRERFFLLLFQFGHHTKKSPKRLNKKKSTKWMRKNDVHLFFEQRLSVTSEINCERDTIFHEQNAVVFRGCVFSVGVVFNRHHAFVERTKFRIQSRANESRN